MVINILNEPPEAKDYEFIVAIPFDEDAGTYMFQGMYENGYFAEQKAIEVGGIIFHNPQIMGKRAPKKEMFYTFKGSWTWGINATSKAEAIRKFEEAYIEDYDIGDYEQIEEEEIY